jgi:hypothetical protein
MTQRALALVLGAALAASAPTVVAAAPAEPSGAHPRLFLDKAMRDAWKGQAKKAGAVKSAIDLCGRASGGGGDFKTDRYMGFNWASSLQACLIAWAATDEDAHAKTAIMYYTALLDDLTVIGDGKGGDGTVRRDSGYAIRLIGPMTALAYDWLHDHKLMTEDLRKKARGRFKAWLEWYIDHGYRPRSPGTNYHAGYLVGATFISIAQGNEAGAYGASLWKHVVNDLWTGDMAKAFGPGPLAGGDWGEGWQYAPLSVTGYAAAARAMKAAGVDVKGVTEWLTALVVRHVHGMTPGRKQTFLGGDGEIETPNINLNGMTLIAVLVGDAPDEVRAWAQSELDKLSLRIGDEFRLYDALAAAKPVAPVEVPRKDWPTWYLARGVGNLYTRSHWGTDSVWTVMQCTSTIDIDHFHNDAGNVVLSRGNDDVIVDPSPYGTLSTLTSNAPTVESAHLPEDYKPSQAWWSLKTKWAFAEQTKSGVVAARCDYADQYKFQDRPSDVPAAMRDMVVVPWDDGRDASLVVIDRAKSGDSKRPLHLRFRTEGKLQLSGDTATAAVGDTALAIQRLWSTSGKPALGASTVKDCFSSVRGKCDAGRFPVTDVRLVVDGPQMEAVHVIAATAAGGAPTAKLEKGKGWNGVWLERKDGAAMVVYGSPSGSLVYQAPAKAATHVVVDAPVDGKGNATITATAKDGGCAVTIASGGSTPAKPAVFQLDDKCAITADPKLTGGTRLGSTSAALQGGGSDTAPGDDDAGVGTGDGPGSDDGMLVGGGSENGQDMRHLSGAPPTGRRTGCCGAQSTPTSPIALSAVVLLVLFGIRRRGG